MLPHHGACHKSLLASSSLTFLSEGHRYTQSPIPPHYALTSFCAPIATLTGKVPFPFVLHPVSLVTNHCSWGLSVPHQVSMCSSPLILCVGFIVAASPRGIQQVCVLLTHWHLFLDHTSWAGFNLPSECFFPTGQPTLLLSCLDISDSGVTTTVCTAQLGLPFRRSSCLQTMWRLRSLGYLLRTRLVL